MSSPTSRPRSGQTLLAALLLAVLWTALPGAGHADARRQRLSSFSDDDLATLEPLLAQGPVALIGFAGADELPEISVVTYAEATAEQVVQVIAKPAAYPSFMPMLDQVQISSERAGQIAYSWRWRVGLFVLEGHNRMHVQPPAKGRPGAPHRVAVYSERGHMGAGRMLWKVHPRGARSLVELSMRVDMRQANVIMEQLDAASRSINRSVNLALSYVMLLGTKAQAERQAGHPEVPATGPARPPRIDPKKLESILRQGDLVWLSTAEHPRSGVWALGRTGVSTQTLRSVLVDPDSFGKGLVPGSRTEVTSKDADGTHFEWEVGLPLIGAEGEMTLRESPAGAVIVRATQGALAGGSWTLDTPKVNDWEATIWAWAQFNVADAGFLIRKIAEVDPTMGHGLAAATQVMMLRALRNRAWAEARRKRAASRAEAQQREAAGTLHPAQMPPKRPESTPRQAPPAKR